MRSDVEDRHIAQTQRLREEWIFLFPDRSVAALRNIRYKLITPFIELVPFDGKDSRYLGKRFEPQSNVFIWAKVRFTICFPT